MDLNRDMDSDLDSIEVSSIDAGTRSSSRHSHRSSEHMELSEQDSDPVQASIDSDSELSDEDRSYFTKEEKERQFKLAIQGQKLPDLYLIRHSTLVSPAIPSVIHGLRYHISFANSPEVISICNSSQHPSITRARNARLIMSNLVPDIGSPDFYPYCIWHPDLALEETYREVARRYPAMKYNVGRACAAAGYVALYRELDLLPDISIAEEARDNAENSQEIFADIMSKPEKYSIMDDYNRSVNTTNPKSGAFLNGDTAVRSSLDIKYNIGKMLRVEQYFNITEDFGINFHEGIKAQFKEPAILGPENVYLLYRPLPQDLPAVNKDILILMAAYEGNIDRYVRLRRPRFVDLELLCIIRGIYYHTSFAKWWAEELDAHPGKYSGPIHKAVNARFIMHNLVYRITADTPHEYLPYVIWYPLRPKLQTLEELFHRCPHMRQAIAHASIIMNEKQLFDKIAQSGQVSGNEWLSYLCPTPQIIGEAKDSPDKYYYEHLVQLYDERISKYKPFSSRLWDRSYIPTIREDKEPTSIKLIDGIRVMGVDEISEHGALRCQANSGEIDLYMCISDELRRELANAGEARSLYEEV
jgi:hypothetical protein